MEPDIEVEIDGSDSSVDLEWTWDWIPSGFICERSFEIESDPGDPDGRKKYLPGRSVLWKSHNFPPGVAAETLKRMLLKENGII